MSFEDFLQLHNINLRIEYIPSYVNGFAYYNGIEYLVIINSRCSSYQQQETLVHEMIHIFENHFTCDKCYEERCEKEVHYLIKEMKTNYIYEENYNE